MKRLAIAIALAIAGFACHAHGQSAGVTTPGKAPAGGGPSGGLAGQHQPRSPEQIAEELLKKFDADSDGKLSQAELTQALEALGEHHHFGGGGGRHGRGGARPHPGTGAPGGAGGLGSLGTQGNSGAQGSSAAQTNSGAQASSESQDGNQDRPSKEEIAAHLIEKYAADKKGLKAEELATAIREHRANQGQSGQSETQ